MRQNRTLGTHPTQQQKHTASPPGRAGCQSWYIPPPQLELLNGGYTHVAPAGSVAYKPAGDCQCIAGPGSQCQCTAPTLARNPASALTQALQLAAAARSTTPCSTTCSVRQPQPSEHLQCWLHYRSMNTQAYVKWPDSCACAASWNKHASLETSSQQLALVCCAAFCGAVCRLLPALVQQRPPVLVA